MAFYVSHVLKKNLQGRIWFIVIIIIFFFYFFIKLYKKSVCTLHAYEVFCITKRMNVSTVVNIAR